MQIARKALTGIAVAVALGFAALVLVPGFTGMKPIAILSGSMEPTISAGDAIIVKPYEDVDRQAVVGDVVTFQPVSNDPYLVTHRIIGKTVGQAGGSEYITQGDANGAPDDPLKAGQIMGKTVLVVPLMGHLISLSLPVRLAVAAVLVALIYIPSAITGSLAKRRAENTSKDQELVDN